MFKLLGLFGFLAVASAADVILGREGGKIIFDKNVTASPAIWTQVRNVTVNATADEIIRRVEVIDNRPLKDGEAKIVEGGDGQKNVTIELKGPAVFRGLDFTIKVFADEETSQFPPKSVGIDAQNHQVPMTKDINVNEKETSKNKNGDDVINETPKPVTSTTEASKTDGHVTNPAAAGKDQTRLYRDTKDQKINGQNPSTTTTTSTTPSSTSASSIIPSSTTLAPTKDVTSESPQQTPDHDKDFDEVVRSIFADNTTQKVPQVNAQVQPVTPQVQEPFEPKAHDLKNDGQILLPKDIAVSTEFSTQMTTEPTKLGQKSPQKHAIPLPYEYLNH